jgi:hypothetical protein
VRWVAFVRISSPYSLCLPSLHLHPPHHTPTCTKINTHCRYEVVGAVSGVSIALLLPALCYIYLPPPSAVGDDGKGDGRDEDAEAETATTPAAGGLMFSKLSQWTSASRTYLACVGVVAVGAFSMVGCVWSVFNTKS